MDELRELVDHDIRSYLEERRDHIPEAGELLAEIERIVSSGGKRLRPALCYWGFRAAGGAHDRRIVRASVSFELLHTFALVHDDIMDSSPERRGRPTSFALLGLEGALLVGDLALVLADNALLSAGFTPAAIGAAYAAYAKMQQRVIAGQHLDVSASEALDAHTARRIARLKSGSYSIEGPLVVGARLAGAPEATVTSLRKAGAPAGEAFQLRDDILGLFGDPAVTGKSSDADVRDGKRNHLFAQTMVMIGDGERDRFTSIWGGGAALGAADIEWARSLVESCGARDVTEKLIESHEAAAFEELEKVGLPEDARAALADLIHSAVDRSS